MEEDEEPLHLDPITYSEGSGMVPESAAAESKTASDPNSPGKNNDLTATVSIPTLDSPSIHTLDSPSVPSLLGQVSKKSKKEVFPVGGGLQAARNM